VPEVTIYFWIIAAGDYIAETSGLGYWKSILLFGGAITVAHLRFGLNAITTSYIFLATILALVLYLSITRVDQSPAEPEAFAS
jgi:uncharacterized membrane-anchored protein